MTTTDKPPIDTATVQRCIKLLKGTGEYRRVIHWERPGGLSETRESWSYTTHPMDLLAGLLKTEPTEAEKLVDAWLDGNMDEDDQDYVRLAQFILDKQKRDGEALMQSAMNNLEDRLKIKASPDEAVAKAIIASCAQPEPQFVFGPWIEWYGGECPVPGDWMVQWLCHEETPDDFDPVVESASDALHHYKNYAIHHYRVRFTVGQWYDWEGGECPVGEGTKGVVRFSMGKENASGEESLSIWAWGHNRCERNDFDIVAFKITSAACTGETA